MTRKGDAVQLLTIDLYAEGYGYVTEHRFHPQRKWRFDVALPAEKLAIEIDGGTWIGGRHTSGAGYEKDCEKLNAAVIEGWRVLRFTSGMVRDGRAMNAINKAMHTYCAQDFHRCDGGGKGEYDRYLAARPAGEG
jgi:very-short-patch-repair endonuclease